MDIKLDKDQGKKVGSHIRLNGKVFGIKLFLDEIISKHEPPNSKEWQTVGNLRLLVIGHYKMGINITPENGKSRLTEYIDYDLPNSFSSRLLGLLFGDVYAKWCVRQMIHDTVRNFNLPPEKLNNQENIILNGILAATALLSIYFITVSLVSGWSELIFQFSSFWYFIITLALLFGIQVSLYTYLKNILKKRAPSHILAVSGSTSTAAMISCCAHYLVNFVPLLGTIGIITLITQYQIQLFWLGLLFNFGGLFYLLFQINKILKVT